MRSYLDLIPISSRVHKKQNRMSIFCIALAVFLVTVIFGMADMFIRSQILQTEQEGGKWHIAIKEISDQEAALILARPEIQSTSRYGVLNYRGDKGYTLSGKNIIIAGSDESWASDMLVDFIAEGKFPQNDNEAMLTVSAKCNSGIEIGDQITIDGPDGTVLQYTVSGFSNNVIKTMSEDSYAAFLTTEAYRAIASTVKSNELADYNSVLYVQFAEHTNAQKIISGLKVEYGLSDRQVVENVKILGLTGQSKDLFMIQIYGTAAVLFLLVMIAGVLMITSSLNSNIAQRTEFFGMIRCIGATPEQIMKLVRKEALNWCRLAIPGGVLAGLFVIWILCAVLRLLSPEYFAAMPVLGVSFPSVIAGICMGILTVRLAARAPAKRASRVSPLAAVSGFANDLQPVRKATNTRFFKIDTALGLHHARASRKNFILMVGSFSLSIILFLGFSVTIDFANHMLNPLYPWTADISVISPDETCSVDSALLEKLQDNPAVKRIYGRMFAYDVPVTVDGKARTADLISYEQHQFQWARDYRVDGSLAEVQQGDFTGAIVYEPQNTIKTGDMVRLDIGGHPADIRIAATLSKCPFDNAPGVGTIICSESTFGQLTGQSNYTILDIQLTRKATDADVDAIHRLVGTGYTFSDERLSNQSVMGAYYSFGIFIYGFMALIAAITVFNIINSVAMSVASRMGQYGVFRAIGLSGRQLRKMVLAEASAYAVTGCICGCIIGIPVNKILFAKLVTFRWGDRWTVPGCEIGIILGIVAASVLLAVWEPMRRMRKLSVVDTVRAE